MKLTKSQLKRIIKEEMYREQQDGSAQNLAIALYAIEDNVEQRLYGTELEPLVRQLTDAIKTKLGREDLTSSQS
jgi:hypothetical protein